MNCHNTHHLDCDSREHKVAVLIKAALDAAANLDGIKNYCPHEEERQQSLPIVERVYDAVEALGVEIGAEEETHL